MIKPTTNDLRTILWANPHQELNSVWIGDHKSWLILTTQNIVLHCDGERWWWHYWDGYNPPTQDVVKPTQFASLDPKDVHAEIDRVLNIAKQIHTKADTMTRDTKEQTTMTAEQLFEILGHHPYPYHGPTSEELDPPNVRIGIGETCLRYDGAWNSCGYTTPCMISENNVTAVTVHAEISRVLAVFAKTTTPSWEQIKADCVGLDSSGAKVQFTNSDAFVSIDRYRELEAELKTMTTSRDEARKNYLTLVNNNPLSPTINTIAEKLGVCPAEPGPMFEKIDRLKSKADRSGLLSVVCRRLCGDENASIETVHKALDLFDDQRNALDYIGEKVGSVPFHLGEVQSLVAQAIKSLGEKTVEFEQSKQTIEWTTKEMEKLRFDRDTERVGNKRLTETIEDLKRTTVKLPNEHTLRRLFNRHNTPDKYDDGTTIPTIERFLLIIENLCRNSDCAERRFEELNAISTRVNTESEDAHATLDEMGIPRWTTVGNHNERYLSLSARIRSLFTTKV